MPERIDAAVVGAGPFGLSVAAHLAAGLRVRVFGRPMETWHTSMPPQMLLRSAWEETSLSAPGRAGTIEAWARAAGEEREEPIPLQKFLRYADWFRQSFVPDLDQSNVSRVDGAAPSFRIRTAGGGEVEAANVVVAVGITPFAHAPPPLDLVRGEHVHFASDGLDFTRYEGRRVVVVGGGQSGIESATLAAGAGADVELVVRSRLHWFADREPQNPRGRMAHLLYRLAYPAVGYGPPPLNRVALRPNAYSRIPSSLRNRLTRRLLRAGASPWLRGANGTGFRITERTTVETAESRPAGVRLQLSDGSTREVDDVVVAAGYRFSLDRLDFLSEEVRQRIAVENGRPVLDRWFRSTDPNVLFVGYAAEHVFGPISRFVLGTEFTAKRVRAALEGGVKT